MARQKTVPRAVRKAATEEEQVQLVKTLTKQVVQSIMVLDHSKKPFKQSDILGHTPRPTKKTWSLVMDEATKELKSLGLELHETAHTSVKMYFVTSTDPPMPTSYTAARKEEVADRTLLALILAYIFMKNGVVTSDCLLQHLEDLDIYNESCAEHPYFGNIKKKIFSQFVEQLYLFVRKIPESELMEVLWGQRAKAEITKRDILQFVCDVGYEGKVSPEYHYSQYREVLEQEGKIVLEDSSDEQSGEETGEESGDASGDSSNNSSEEA